jgi:hypothetical protein
MCNCGGGARRNRLRNVARAQILAPAAVPVRPASVSVASSSAGALAAPRESVVPHAVAPIPYSHAHTRVSGTSTMTTTMTIAAPAPVPVPVPAAFGAAEGSSDDVIIVTPPASASTAGTAGSATSAIARHLAGIRTAATPKLFAPMPQASVSASSLGFGKPAYGPPGAFPRRR